jgi:hypothetical protein
MDGVRLCLTVDKMLNFGIHDGPQLLSMPTAIATESEFEERVPRLLEKLWLLLGLVHSTSATPSSRPIFTLISPGEFRWVGGEKKESVGAMSLSLGPNPSEFDSALYAIISLDKREVSPNNLLIQFQGRNGWPEEGEADRGTEHYFHAGRPQYSRYSKDPQPPFDMKKMMGQTVDMPEFEKLLEGNICLIILFFKF